MRQIEYSGQFKRDLRLAIKQGKNMEKLKRPMRLLVGGLNLPEAFSDHPLKGDWQGCRDLHIEPDWILIYRLKESVLRFERTGSHSDLF